MNTTKHSQTLEFYVAKGLSLLSVALLSLALAACGGATGDEALAGANDQRSNTPQRPPDLERSIPERPKYPGGIGCGWQIASDVNITNVAFPDESAKYWVAIIPQLPNTRIRIDGRFGHMRYFSFNVYDPMLRPDDAIADVEIIPNNGKNNPFIDPTAPLGGSYTAYIEFADKPEDPAPNTIYLSSFAVEGLDALKTAGLFYRSYVPEEGYDFDGGVGLPLVTLEDKDSGEDVLAFADCDEPLAPTLGGNLPDLGVNDLIIDLDLPDEAYSLFNFPTATMPPRTYAFYGLPTVVSQIIGMTLGVPLGEESTGLPFSGGGGFLSNLHNHYTYTPFSRYFGSAYLVRARAPSWRGAPGVQWNTEQLRFWSICQNEFATQRYVDCKRDDEVVTDESGFYTVLVTDPDDRPEWATAENGVNWLPWGQYPDGVIIYRHMLAHPDFTETIANIPQGTKPSDIMGDYAPVGAYCTAEQLTAEFDSPASLFSACLQHTLDQNPQTGAVPALLPAGLLTPPSTN